MVGFSSCLASFCRSRCADEDYRCGIGADGVLGDEVAESGAGAGDEHCSASLADLGANRVDGLVLGPVDSLGHVRDELVVHACRWIGGHLDLVTRCNRYSGRRYTPHAGCEIENIDESCDGFSSEE